MTQQLPLEKEDWEKELSEKWPYLRDLSILELAQMRLEARKVLDTELEKGVLLEFRWRAKEIQNKNEAVCR